MDHFDIQYLIANYLESHDLGNYRLVCKWWYEVYRKHLETRCFKCLKHSTILYHSNHCHRRVCESCASDRFYNLSSSGLYKRIAHQKKHKKRMRVVFTTYLEYPNYLQKNPKLLQDSYHKLCELIAIVKPPFQNQLLQFKQQYDLLL